MKIRNMDTRVEIYRRDPGKDDFGQPKETRSLFAARWASVEPVQSGERVTSAAEVGETVYRLTFRRDSVTESITHDDELRFDGVSLDIDPPTKAKDRRSLVVVGRG